MEFQDTLDRILEDKQQNLLPENLKAGVSCLGVIGTLEVGEDLSEQLAAQDKVIAELQEAVKNKTSGGGSGKPNVFMQLDEPSTKNGIWFKTDNTFDNIETADKVASDEFTWNVSKANIPYNFYQGSAVSVGTDIYVFGGSEGGYSYTCYKYDTLMNSYTKMTSTIYGFYQGSAVLVGTDIYLFNSTNCHKYNTLTDSYTLMAKIPYTFYDGSAVSVGTDIYLFGSSNGSANCYKYDTLTNSYTKMANIPYSFYQGSSLLVGTDIYLFGGNGSAATCYKYDTLTNSYTQMADMPYSFYQGSAVLVGTDVYLFGSYISSRRTTCYKYDTLTNSYTKMANIPYNFYQGSAVLAGMNIYLFGGKDNPNKVQVMEFPVIEFEDKTVLIQNGTGLKVELVSTNVINGLKNEFKDTYYYTTEGGLNETIPTYIGDGEEWTKIRGGAE